MKILIYGIAGTMGKFVFDSAKARGITNIVGVDPFADPKNFLCPVYKNFTDIKEKCDVIIDFSHKSTLASILEYAVNTGTPTILCTTGYDEGDNVAIATAAQKVALFQSGNMSVGVNVLQKLVREAAKFLKGADIEIIEQHHNKKVDAPSGTALMLANTVKEVLPETEFLYGREGMVGKRTKNEVAIHAVRGGTIVGKHEIVFAMNNQVITIKHEAESKGVFAEGSIDAAEWIIGKAPGKYSMDDVLR